MFARTDVTMYTPGGPVGHYLANLIQNLHSDGIAHVLSTRILHKFNLNSLVAPVGKSELSFN